MQRNTLISEKFIHPCLNETQKNILECTINFLIEDIIETLDPIQIRPVLEITRNGEAEPFQLQALANREILTSVLHIQEIFAHPCPQNRRSGHPEIAWLVYHESFNDEERRIFDSSQLSDGILGGLAYFKIGRGEIGSEPQGIFGLTSRNDNTARPVTKDAVVQYIKYLIDEAIIKYSDKPIIEFGFHRSHVHPSFVISKNDWIISLLLRNPNEVHQLYIEGVHENGLPFLEIYSAQTDGYNNSVTIKVEKPDRENYYWGLWAVHNFHVSATKAKILKNLIREDVTKSMETIEYTSNSTFMFFRRDNYSKKWALNKLKEINLELPKKPTLPKTTVPYGEVLNNYRRIFPS